MRFLLAFILCASTTQAGGYRYGGAPPGGTYVNTYGLYLQPGEELRVVAKGWELRPIPKALACLGCRYSIDEGDAFCKYCGRKQGVPDTKPTELTFGTLLRALDEITEAHTDIIDGMRCRHVTVRDKGFFKEWKEVQKTSGGEYIFLHQQLTKED